MAQFVWHQQRAPTIEPLAYLSPISATEIRLSPFYGNTRHQTPNSLSSASLPHRVHLSSTGVNQFVGAELSIRWSHLGLSYLEITISALLIILMNRSLAWLLCRESRLASICVALFFLRAACTCTRARMAQQTEQMQVVVARNLISCERQARSCIVNWQLPVAR